MDTPEACSEAQRPRIIIISGPTAVGKTEFSLQLSERLNAEIVNADSLQVYRYLDIGTAKVSPQERARVHHHLIDILDPDQEFNVADYKRYADDAIQSIISRGKRVLVVGGTGLYIRVLVHGIFDAPAPDENLREQYRLQAERDGMGGLYARLQDVDPQLASRIHWNDMIRISRGLEVYDQTGRPLSQLQAEHQFKTPCYNAIKICLLRDRSLLYERVNQRVEQMFQQGLIDEYKSILDRGYDRQVKPLCSLGYRQVGQHLFDGMELNDAIEDIKTRTRRYAKQQISWFRKEAGVHWAEAHQLCESLVFEQIVDDLEGFFTDGQASMHWATAEPYKLS